MRAIEINAGEHYHIYNRGNDKKEIFLGERDRVRFLFLILYFQSPINFEQIHRNVDTFLKKKTFDMDASIASKVIQERYVELESFAFMPNHFHLIVRQKQNQGISQYMQRILNGYTKYFNAKYEKSGHLFQGPYKIVRVTNNEQLLHLSAYIHRNPREIKEWAKKENQYPWSSYQDYITQNRWSGLLAQKIILKQFENGKEYENFVRTSGAKELHEELKLD